MRNFLAGKATPAKNGPSSSIPSSSPAFATPAHPLRPYAPGGGAPSADAGRGAAASTTNVLSTPTPAKQAILPIVLAPATLRPLAFRTFTKKHSLTLTSPALQELAVFIGRHCGSGWREEGLAERVLEEVARSWKNANGGVIVVVPTAAAAEGSANLKDILKTLEGNMSGGRIIQAKRSLLRQDSLTLNSSAVPEADVIQTRLGMAAPRLARVDSAGLGASQDDHMDDVDDASLNDVRKWLNVISAFDQPRMIYSATKKHFEHLSTKPSILPSAASKTAAFRHRYHVIHQRLMRNEAFQTSAVTAMRGSRNSLSSGSAGGGQKITPVANLLGRHGSHHMLLGLLTLLPAGGTGISDLSGTIAVDLSQAAAVPHDSAWFTPGMIVLVDGIYEEDDDISGSASHTASSAGLPGSRGVGGFIGGRFQAFFIGQPPCERRATTLGISAPAAGDSHHHSQTHTIGGGFGWTDFLGLGSERGVGAKMRRIEDRLARSLAPAEARTRRTVVVLGEVNLNRPRTLEAVRAVLTQYASAVAGVYPLAFILTGSFTDGPIMASGGGSGSVEYKEYFDALAATIGEFPALMQNSSFVFVPGDNDGWISAATAGASVPLPRKSVPEMFTSRLRRMFAAAPRSSNSNASSTARAPPEVVWTSNPSRLALFGPTHEIVLFRDDLSARLRRAAVQLKADRDALQEVAVAQDDGADDVPEDLDDLMEVETTDGQARQGEEPQPQPERPEDHRPQQQQQQEVDPGVKSSRKLVKTLLDQGYMAPFRPEIRPVHWDHAGALQLYPLPTAVVLVDSTSNPFAVTYEGCHVVNPGTLLVAGRKGQARWAEYEVGRVGKFQECSF